jgi:hypothetical protein
MDETKTYSRGNDDWSFARLESSQSLLAFFLGCVTVNRGDWEVLAIKELVQLIGTLLRLNEDQGQTRILVEVVA